MRKKMDTKVLTRLQTQCSRREYCSREVYAKAVKALEGDESGAAEIVEALEKDGFVDDGRYAAAFARDKSALSGWGPVKIRSALLARGVPREAVLEALETVDPDRATARLEKVLETKWRTLRDDPQGRLKLIRFALSRGYDYDPVRPLVERITRPDAD